LLEPSLVLHSGGGLYTIHKLAQPVEVRDETTRSDFAALVKAWGRSHRVVAERHGWHSDSTDLSRVLRPAGVARRKPGVEPNLVTVRTGYVDGGGLYTLKQIRGACVEPIVTPREPRATQQPVDGLTVWGVFAEIYTLAEVLDDARSGETFGPWADAGSDARFDYWRRAGTTNAYSIKQNRDTGVIIVWSSTVAAHLGVDDGDGLDLFGFYCRLNRLDPAEVARDVMRRVRARPPKIRRIKLESAP
jgi:hypothetical protein